MPMPYEPMIGVTSLPSAPSTRSPIDSEYLIAELENVPDFDCLRDFERLAAIDARVAGRHLPQVHELRPKIFARRDVAQVMVVLVRARDHVAAALQARCRPGSACS